MEVREKLFIDGGAGRIEASLHSLSTSANNVRAIALVAHPHPMYGGTMDNKVVHTIYKALLSLDMVVLRWNSRSVGKSTGSFDNGRGETTDMLILADWLQERFPGKALYAAGYSFGANVVMQAQREKEFHRLLLVGSAIGDISSSTIPDNSIIIHGAQDEIIHLHEVMNWARDTKLIIHVLGSANHFFDNELKRLRNLILTVLN